jgi:hypothetical protein
MTSSKRLGSIILLAGVLGGCAGLTPNQDAGWVAFHACQPGAPSAAMDDILVTGRVNYRTQEGNEFSAMKACMEARGYRCDLGVTIGSRPQTYCYPGAS